LTSSSPRRATAQAQYDLAQANTAQHDAMYTLLAAIGTAADHEAARGGNASAAPAAAAHRTHCRRRAQRGAAAAAPTCSPTWRSCALRTRKSQPHAPLWPRKFRWARNVQGNLGRLNVNNSPYFSVNKPQGAALLKFRMAALHGRIAAEQVEPRRLSKREEAAGRAERARRPGFARGGARLLTRSIRGYSNTMPPSPLQTASEGRLPTAPATPTRHGVGTLNRRERLRRRGSRRRRAAGGPSTTRSR